MLHDDEVFIYLERLSQHWHEEAITVSASSACALLVRDSQSFYSTKLWL